MARTRKSALDSVLDEIKEPGQPSLQDMLKAKAEAEKEEEEMERLKKAENPSEDIPIMASEEQMHYDPDAPVEDIGKIVLMDGEQLVENFTHFGEWMKDAPAEESAPDIMETEVAVVTEPVKAVTIEEQYQDLKLTQREKDMVLDGRLKEILGVPKARTAVPTLVRYRQDGQLALRGVIIDIGEYELTEGWKLYKSQVEDATPEKYLLKVYELTQTEIPRMYRTVGEMRLE